jgi:hypothetical protein
MTAHGRASPCPFRQSLLELGLAFGSVEKWENFRAEFGIDPFVEER